MVYWLWHTLWGGPSYSRTICNFPWEFSLIWESCRCPLYIWIWTFCWLYVLQLSFPILYVFLFYLFLDLLKMYTIIVQFKNPPSKAGFCCLRSILNSQSPFLWAGNVGMCLNTQVSVSCCGLYSWGSIIQIFSFIQKNQSDAFLGPCLSLIAHIYTCISLCSQL